MNDGEMSVDLRMSTKKVKKKTVVKKKAVKKKRSVKKTEKKNSSLFKKAPKNREFYAIDGNVFDSVKEFSLGLREMNDNTFWHHVTPDRNDFANWVEEIFKDKELAEQLHKAADKTHTEIIVLRHIVKKS